jgi:hypothetical protein
LIDKKKWVQIVALDSKQIGLDKILASACSIQEMETARSVGTTLRPLRNAQTQALIKHGEVLTELQVNLYLPLILQ